VPLLCAPLLQCYLIWVGVIVAYIFTFIPEWTAWVLLCLMALYDIAAVLIPGGPLKVRCGRDLAPSSAEGCPARERRKSV
jgi:presenilin 1